MENYLSIGDVSRLSGVGVKALRYYEKIGIFKPAYINPETGYRYYVHDQILFLDMIQLCLEIGLPLSTAAKYIQPDGTVLSRELFIEGLHQAQEKVKRLNRKIQHINYALDQMNAEDQFASLVPGQIYTRHFPARKIFAVNRNELGLHLSRNLSWEKINIMARDAQIDITYPSGSVISRSPEGSVEHLFMEAHTEDQNCYYVRYIPEGDFRCIRVTEEDQIDLHPLLGKEPPSTYQFVVNSVMTPTNNYRNHLFELQLPLRSDYRVWIDP